MTGLSSRDKRTIAQVMDKVADLRRQVERQARAQHAPWTTIQAGQGPEVVDEAGQVIGRIGGTSGELVEYVPGPPPDAPSAPLVDAGALSVQVTVMDAQPAGVRACSVYASTAPGEDGSVVGSIPAGGTAVAVTVPAGTWHIRVQWVMLSSQTSPLSEPVTVDVEPLVDTADIEAVLETARGELAAATTQAQADLAELDRLLSERITTGDAAPIALDRLAAGDADEAVLDALYSQLAVVNRLTALEAWIGGALLKDGAITTAKLLVTEEMVAEFFRVKKVQAGDIDVNNLVGATAFLQAIKTSEIILESTANGLTTQVSGSGIVVAQRNEETDGSVTLNPVVQLGSFAENSFATRDPATGDTLASIGADGSGSFATVVTGGDPTVQGAPVVGSALAHYEESDQALSLLESMPWGEVAYVDRNSQSSGPYSAREVGTLDLVFSARPGRRYRVEACTGHLYGNNTPITGSIRYVVSGNPITDTSPQLDVKGFRANVTSEFQPIFLSSYLNGPAEGAEPVRYALMLTIRSTSAFEFVNGDFFKHQFIRVVDAGPIRDQAGVSRSATLWQAGSTPSPETPSTPAKTARTTTWAGTAMASYYRGGSERQTSGVGSGMLKQGVDPHWQAGGNQASMFLLDKSSIAAALSGATVNKATLTLKSSYAAGGGAKRIRLYWHGYTSIQSTYPSGITYAGEWNISDGGTLAITLPITVRTALAQGQVGGFSFSTAGSTLTRYALGISWATRPRLTINYTK